MDPTATECVPNTAVSSQMLSTAAANTRRDEALQVWKQNVQRWYPKLQERAYFVPPVYMKRINYETETVGAETVAVAQPPVKATPKGTGQISESDVLEDQAQQHILHCLHKFFQQNNQVVFVLSQLNFTSYLGEVCFEAAARELPRTVDLKARNQDRGDFDFLFIHCQYGLVASEVKSVGMMFSGEVADQPREDKALVKRLQQATRQMNKSRDVLQHLIGDLSQPPRVTTSLMLPYITAARLSRVLTDNPRERQALCDCLGIPHCEDPVKLCLTSDRLSEKTRFWHVTDDVIQALTQWWSLLMEERGEDASMTEQLYEDLIARFAGPATTVEVFCPSALPRATKVVRSEGEAVSETAERYMDLVLSPQQIQILNSREKLVYLTGPPGTGKTVMLLLKARQWLAEGHEVHVTSVHRESTAATYYLYEALNQNLSSEHGGKVLLHRDVKDFPTVVCRNSFCHSDIYLIADEVDARVFKQLYDTLRSTAKVLHVWSARIISDLQPPDFTVYTLNVPLRSPACVTREVQASISGGLFEQVMLYEENPYPHTDGPRPRELRHQGPGHDDDVKPDECETCGLQLAAVLRELHVGESTAATSPDDSPRTLRYRDVFVLTMTDFRDASANQSGETVPASGLIRGLRQAGVPVTVFTEYVSTYDDNIFKTFEEVATMTGPDAVLAAHVRTMSGLERKVVAWVQTEIAGSLAEICGRAFGYSRSSAQLIIISWPQNISTEQKEDQDNQARGHHGESETAHAGATDPSPQQLQVFDDRQVMEELFRVLHSNITEEDARNINAVLQVTVTFNDGADDETFYLSLKDDGDRLIRGAWPGEEPEIACKLVLASKCFQRGLVEGEKAFADMLKHTCCTAQVFQFGEALRMASFLQRVQPQLKAVVLRMKGETTRGPEV